MKIILLIQVSHRGLKPKAIRETPKSFIRKNTTVVSPKPALQTKTLNSYSDETRRHTCPRITQRRRSTWDSWSSKLKRRNKRPYKRRPGKITRKARESWSSTREAPTSQQRAHKTSICEIIHFSQFLRVRKPWACWAATETMDRVEVDLRFDTFRT